MSNGRDIRRGKPSDRTTGRSTHRSLEQAGRAMGQQAGGSQPPKCATAAAGRESILGHERSTGRPKLAGSFEGIKRDI